MKVTITIEANHLDEVAHLFRQPSKAYTLDVETLKEVAEDPYGDAVEVERPIVEYKEALEKASEDYAKTVQAEEFKQLNEVAKPKRGRPPKSKEPEKAPESSFTLEDVKSAVSKVMDSGKATGVQVRDMLVNSFGVQAFGKLKPEQYADVIGEVENLAA